MATKSMTEKENTLNSSTFNDSNCIHYIIVYNKIANIIILMAKPSI